MEKFSFVLENFVGIDLINTVDPNIFSFCFLVKILESAIFCLEGKGRFVIGGIFKGTYESKM